LDPLTDYSGFNFAAKSFEYRNERLKLQRISVLADLIKERCIGVPVKFSDLMQADWIVFLRYKVVGGDHSYWWPHTLVYSVHANQTFPIMVRCRSRRYFERAKCVFGAKDKEDLEAVIDAVKGRPEMLPRFGVWRLNVSSLADVAMIETNP
jgi:hypothetical protein